MTTRNSIHISFGKNNKIIRLIQDFLLLSFWIWPALHLKIIFGAIKPILNNVSNCALKRNENRVWSWHVPVALTSIDLFLMWRNWSDSDTVHRRRDQSSRWWALSSPSSQSSEENGSTLAQKPGAVPWWNCTFNLYFSQYSTRFKQASAKIKELTGIKHS